MKKDNLKTDVVFYYEAGSKTNEVFAVFPQMIERDIDTPRELFYTCYAHIGQHSLCSNKYVKQCKKATEEYFKPLAEELIQLGYNLNIL